MRIVIIMLMLAAMPAAATAQTVAKLLRADSLRAAGLIDEAAEAYAEVRSREGLPRSWMARALAGEADCHKRAARYDAALADYEEMARLGVLDARARLNLSGLYLLLGQYTAVVDLLEGSPAPVGEATRRLNLASAYAYLGQADKALAAIRETPVGGMDAATRATLDANRGFMELSLGLYAEAAASLGRALPAMPDGQSRCIVAANMAMAESGAGMTEQALGRIDSCMAWQAARLGKAHPDYATSTRKRAEILMAAGRKAEAAGWFGRYFSLTRSHVLRTFAFLTAKQRQDFWYSRQPLVAECYETEDAAPSLLYSVALFSKSLLLQTERDVRSAAARDTATARLFALVETLRSRAGADSLTPERRTQLEARAYAAERQLMGRLAEYKALADGMSITPADVAARLGKGEAAVEFVRYGKKGSRRYAALVLRHGGGVSFVPLWSEDSLLGFRLAGGLTVGEAVASLRSTAKNSLYADSAASAMVWGPLKWLLASCTKIYFAPDGALHTLAIENMPDATEARARLCRLSSTRELLAGGKGTGGGALVMGGLSYDSCDTTHTADAKPDRTASRVLNSLQLPPAARGLYAYLPQTAAEADTIAAMLGGTGGAGALCLKGTHGTETALGRLAAGRAVIHIATHGFCLDAAGDDEPLAYCRDSLREDASLNRAGLIMAGANRMVNPAFKAYDDGILLASEVARLRLDSCAVVTLSACQTGLGPVTPDGVFGLQRGLKKAGAAAIVASLWNVDDRATRLLMTSFYANMAKGMAPWQALASAREALRSHTEQITVETEDYDTSRPQVRRLGRWVWPKKTRTETIRPYADPQYWAAFIVIDGLGT